MQILDSQQPQLSSWEEQLARVRTGGQQLVPKSIKPPVHTMQMRIGVLLSHSANWKTDCRFRLLKKNTKNKLLVPFTELQAKLNCHNSGCLYSGSAFIH